MVHSSHDCSLFHVWLQSNSFDDAYAFPLTCAEYWAKHQASKERHYFAYKDGGPFKARAENTKVLATVIMPTQWRSEYGKVFPWWPPMWPTPSAAQCSSGVIWQWAYAPLLERTGENFRCPHLGKAMAMALARLAMMIGCYECHWCIFGFVSGCTTLTVCILVKKKRNSCLELGKYCNN